MKIGMIGLGKLGTPVALAMCLKGHDVMGFDINPERMQKESFPFVEKGPSGENSIEQLLRESSLKFGTMAEVVHHSEIIFVAVQTPHDPKFEGVTRLPAERKDFDYTYLKTAMINLSAQVDALKTTKIVVIISTALPGTMKREILPLLSSRIKLAYNPFFIAMGTVIPDFLHPEFVLCGTYSEMAAVKLNEFYKTIFGWYAPTFYKTTIENAELIKVAYNTFISMKIVFVNTLMEICHKTGCDVDAVTNALALGTDRLLSSKYMSGGMGDGGGCHPRDNIALSWLARKLNLSYDFFENMMLCREKQTEWLADLIIQYGNYVCILGKAFKPGTAITTGSPAVLLGEILQARGLEVEYFDPYVNDVHFREENLLREICEEPMPTFFIGTKHPEFATYEFPKGSVVLDPWRYIPKQEGVQVIHIGGK